MSSLKKYIYTNDEIVREIMSKLSYDVNVPSVRKRNLIKLKLFFNNMFNNYNENNNLCDIEFVKFMFNKVYTDVFEERYLNYNYDSRFIQEHYEIYMNLKSPKILEIKSICDFINYISIVFRSNEEDYLVIRNIDSLIKYISDNKLLSYNEIEFLNKIDNKLYLLLRNRLYLCDLIEGINTIEEFENAIRIYEENYKNILVSNSLKLAKKDSIIA